jgi:hypothetical protein
MNTYLYESVEARQKVVQIFTFDLEVLCSILFSTLLLCDAGIHEGDRSILSKSL